jgi:predicted transcriptional regulator YheO
MTRILEGLYNQRTKYLESNFELLSAFIKKKVTQRSLLLLFTNFESLSALKRQLPYFKNLSKSHVLVVIFFSNSNMNRLINSFPKDIEKMYHQTIAEHLHHEKILMVKELKKYGIFSVFSEPKNLTVNTINKYLEVKAINV